MVGADYVASIAGEQAPSRAIVRKQKLTMDERQVLSIIT
jgi:hypothetical protein